MSTIFCLLGRPNSGKSTIFNLLTGLSRKVGNFSGISVDLAKAPIQTDISEPLKNSFIMDVPGLFTLDDPNYRTNIGQEEKLTIQFIEKLQTIENYCPVFVLDGENRINSLALYLQISQFIPQMPIIVTKVDHFDHTSEVDQLLQILTKTFQVPIIDIQASALNQNIVAQNRVRLEYFLSDLCNKKACKTSSKPTFHPFGYYILQARQIIGVINTPNTKQLLISKKIDSLVVHPFAGIFIFFLIFYSMFHILYFFTTPIMDTLEFWMLSLGLKLKVFLEAAFGQISIIPEFLIEGLWASFTGIIIFVPQIFILFFLISLLEQSGYLSRASLVMNRFMGRFGLSGKAFVPYLSALACAVPAIMATRTLSDKKERLITIMTIPFITCSARIPVYLLLVGTFMPTHLRALSLFVLFFLGTFVALLSALLFRKFYYKGKRPESIIDMPYYKMPNLKNAAKLGGARSIGFIKKAGTIILFLSLCVWCLGRFPERPVEMSYLGMMGKWISPIIAPIGMDWKMGIGLLSAMGARELFISTLNAVYSADVLVTLQQRILQDPSYNLASVWSLLVFIALACQCISTLGMIKAETKSIRIPAFVFVYTMLVAYGVSFFVYRAMI